MKKILLITLVALIAMPSFAQEEGEIRASLGLLAGTKSRVELTNTGNEDEKLGFGINIGGEYFVTDIISIAPSYSLFAATETRFDDGFGNSASVKYSYTSFNIDGRYYFGDGDIQLYGLAGLSFAGAKVEGNGGSISDSKTGLNLGAGANMPISDTMYLNGQVKYNTPIEQLVLQVGVAYSF